MMSNRSSSVIRFSMISGRRPHRRRKRQRGDSCPYYSPTPARRATDIGQRAPRMRRRVNMPRCGAPEALMSTNPKARILAEALPYIRAYHGKTLVIRFGGNAMADPALKAGFARDVALLRLVGMKAIVVHGGGWNIDELMRQMGLESRRYRGLRITDERTLTIVEMALSQLNQE